MSRWLDGRARRPLTLTLADLRLAALRVVVAALIPAFLGYVGSGGAGGPALVAAVVMAWVMGPATLVERATLRGGFSPLLAGAAVGLASAVFVPAALVQAVWLASVLGGGPTAGDVAVDRFLHAGGAWLLVGLGLFAFVAHGGAAFMHGVVAGGLPTPSPRNALARWLLEPLLATGAVTIGLPLAASNAVAGALERLLVGPGPALARQQEARPDPEGAEP